MFVLTCVLVFVISFAGSVAFKMKHQPAWTKAFRVAWSDKVGTVYRDLSYGPKEANQYDLYVPADTGRPAYGLVVYLHAGGFTAGDKAGDKEMLEWLCSLGYVTAGINYTLFGEKNPQASVYSQSLEIKESIPAIVDEAKRLGYPIDGMAIGGGSAGGTLAMLYAYRDAKTSPVPVKLLFEAVGPASFDPKNWDTYGLDQSPEAAAGLFSVMAGQTITPEMIEDGSYVEAMKPVWASMWVGKDTVPSVIAYGAHDKVCPFKTAKPLVDALRTNDVPMEYFEMPHSGHGLQNDSALYRKYMEAVRDNLARYLPVSERK